MSEFDLQENMRLGLTSTFDLTRHIQVFTSEVTLMLFATSSSTTTDHPVLEYIPVGTGGVVVGVGTALIGGVVGHISDPFSALPAAAILSGVIALAVPFINHWSRYWFWTKKSRRLERYARLQRRLDMAHERIAELEKKAEGQAAGQPGIA
jgi:hypothetical protein